LFTSEKQLEQAKEIVGLLQKEFSTNGYLGVEIDSPFDNLERYTIDYTIINCLFENIVDEIFILSEGIKYDDDLFGLTKIEAKSHIKKLQKFIKLYAVSYFKYNEVFEYIRKAEKVTE
jgi:hypothetical protein